MTLKEQLKIDLKEAMRAKEIVRRDSIRSINTMIKQIEVDQRIELEDADIIILVQKGIKQREEAIVQYKAASRDDLLQKEQEQIDIYKVYLPIQISDEKLEDEMKDIISKLGATSMKEMGKVMGLASKHFAGVANGKRINEMVKKLLG